MVPTEASLPNASYSRELSRLLSRSKLINKHFEDNFDISFSSLFLAFLVNDDIISKWFQDYVRKSKINVDMILKERKMTKQLMDKISASQPIDTSHHNYRLTTSADTYLKIAENFRQGLLPENKSDPLEVRHLMAVFIYEPWVHEKDLIRWGFNRENWSNAFLGQIKASFTDELNFWKKQHLRAFHIQAKF